MHDINFIRNNPDLFDLSLINRGLSPLSLQCIELDKERKEKIAKSQVLKERKNVLIKDIASKKIRREDVSSDIEETKAIQSELDLVEESRELENLLSRIPNILQEDVPIGTNEADNKKIKTWGQPTIFNFEPKAHFEIGAFGMDFEQTVKISGSRFVTLKGQLARLHRILANFMIDKHTKIFGYQEICPPCLVLDSSMYGVGQLPKFDEESFKTTYGHRLIPTSEVPLTNLVRDRVLTAAELPLRFCALTDCFRSEAGSAGKDTRGMFRLHQFSKVELVSIVHPDESNQEHERMLECAESILRDLELPYRVMLLCSGDTGFSSSKTYDIEVWLPSQKRYREISSCSNCLDFQSRRMNARFREESKNAFVHTLNGSGVAVGRALIAILENYQTEEGSIIVPKVLRDSFGADVIPEP